MEKQKSAPSNLKRVNRNGSVSLRVQKRKRTALLINCNCVNPCSNYESMQNFLSSIPYHVIFGFLNPLLVGVLQERAGGKINSSFETHQANMWTFLVTTFFYCFAFAADMKSKLHHTKNSQPSSCQSTCNSQQYSKIFGAIAVISGSLSSVSLVFIFLPHPCGYLIFIAWGIVVPVIVAYQCAILIKNVYSWIQEKIKEINSKFSDFCYRFTPTGSNSITQQRESV